VQLLATRRKIIIHWSASTTMEQFTLHEICDLCLVIGYELSDPIAASITVGDVAINRSDTTQNNGNLEEGEILDDDQRARKRVRLDTDTKAYSIRVNRAVISQASPVWHKMLDGAWGESTKSEIALPDDDPDAMLLVLRVAHVQFQLLRKSLTNEMMYELAIVCDKYDCVELLQRWLVHWTKQWSESALSANTTVPAGAPFICWIFGLEKPFSRVMQLLTLSTKCVQLAGPSGDAIYVLRQSNGKDFESAIMPPGALGLAATQGIL
jgi:hypothetical protein